MNHNYKLGDFRMMTEETDTDIHERIVSIDLNNVRELPIIIVQRLEAMINKVITEHEQERNITISLEKMELGMQLDIDTQEKELYLQAYIGYTIEEDCLYGKDIITPDDEDYAVIKKYFVTELNYYVVEQLRRIENCA